jgi:glycosyltransferase involved in cell wall biosynthesis
MNPAVRTDDILVSVVIPALNAAKTLPTCLRGLASQSLPSNRFEIIVVADDRSTDRTAHLAESAGVTTVRHPGPNAAAARNRGIASSNGRWIAFLDADCIPTRGWLRSLVDAAEASGTPTEPPLGAAGQVIGHESRTPAARFVDLTGGLRADRHLSHERYPWAPTANLLYRRAALMAVGGFDERFDSYEGCDLHTRLRRQVGGGMTYVPAAVVLHHHRAGWRAYWRQQVSYGHGFAQFFLRYDHELGWSVADEVRAWLGVFGDGLRSLTKWSGDEALRRRGVFVKGLAQRVGFVTTFWRPGEVSRWRSDDPLGAESAS